MSKPLLFDKAIEKICVLYKYSGMNLRHKIMTPMDVIKHRWLYTFNVMWVFFASIVSIYYIIIGIVNGKNFIDVTSVAPCLILAILALIKSVFHTIHEEHVCEVITLLRDLEMQERDRQKCIAKEKIIEDETGFLNTVINVLYVLNCLMIVTFDMIPMVLIAIKYYKTKEFDMLLPYLDVFAFLPYEIKYWVIAYICEIWTECLVLLKMGAVDYLFFTCCTYIRVQFKLLQHDFERIIPQRSISKGGRYREDEFREHFAKLANWHQDLIRTSNILELIYSKSTLFNFLSSSLVICLTGFIVTIVDDIVIFITFLTFLLMGLMQVFFLCFFADLMMSASIEISSAVYNCLWYYANPGVCRQLLLVQTRAQKPCKLTAAGFADVNLNSFMRILSTAWSYFALLQTMYRG